MALEFCDIEEVFDDIKPGLEQIISECQPDWSIVDVYECCATLQAHILMDPARSASGFVIVQSVPIPFSSKSKLLLWIAHDSEPDSAAAHAAELEHLAKETGHDQIEILTPHMGLVNLAQHFGYVMKNVVLNKKLENQAWVEAAEATPKREQARRL
jgi:hypothetical protein